MTSCNSSDTHFYEPISGLFKVKCHIYCNIYVFFNHLMYETVEIFFLLDSYYLVCH